MTHSLCQSEGSHQLEAESLKRTSFGAPEFNGEVGAYTKSPGGNKLEEKGRYVGLRAFKTTKGGGWFDMRQL